MNNLLNLKVEKEEFRILNKLLVMGDKQNELKTNVDIKKLFSLD